MVTVGAATVLSYGSPSTASPHAVFGLSSACDFKKDFHLTEACRRGQHPNAIVWGDSFAMHLVPGLLKNGELSFVQATKSVCGPVLGLAPFEVGFGKGYDKKWAETCLSFNESVWRYLEDHQEISTVVISSSLSQYFAPGMQVIRSGGAVELGDVLKVTVAFQDTVKRLVALGKTVVFISPTPRADFNPRYCHQRHIEGLFVYGPEANCEISLDVYHEKFEKVIETVQGIRSVDRLRFVSIDDALCGDRVCVTSVNSELIYNDEGHLSVFGSEFVAARLKLIDVIRDATGDTRSSASIGKID